MTLVVSILHCAQGGLRKLAGAALPSEAFNSLSVSDKSKLSDSKTVIWYLLCHISQALCRRNHGSCEIQRINYGFIMLLIRLWYYRFWVYPLLYNLFIYIHPLHNCSVLIVCLQNKDYLQKLLEFHHFCCCWNFTFIVSHHE